MVTGLTIYTFCTFHYHYICTKTQTRTRNALRYIYNVLCRAHTNKITKESFILFLRQKSRKEHIMKESDHHIYIVHESHKDE